MLAKVWDSSITGAPKYSTPSKVRDMILCSSQNSVISPASSFSTSDGVNMAGMAHVMLTQPVPISEGFTVNDGSRSFCIKFSFQPSISCSVHVFQFWSNLTLRLLISTSLHLIMPLKYWTKSHKRVLEQKTSSFAL